MSGLRGGESTLVEPGEDCLVNTSMLSSFGETRFSNTSSDDDDKVLPFPCTFGVASLDSAGGCGALTTDEQILLGGVKAAAPGEVHMR
mmetsp:Transcript_15481/g.32307  ORF Transcript_15481/g.32307 Transcript_15481/m.32307 type:complete len:88 (-) Transcript_15481:544-807(-)|eukprot:CAMPEP_0171347214 /NCGR_PEP_ID=MMETSP0878-20121228/27295_1 /TAXON_ID=67004 /ORGANISM="Thalassiosira weissflogii, Strain CCMP1336" /LENGTH=87 /DNA_ID=CAMNT_0011851173 /DNA_START=186 /DNA_END=449 /DNA_ORIENTATION=-